MKGPLGAAELRELRSVYEECAAAEPRDPGIPRAYGQALLAHGHVVEALEPLARVCELEPRSYAPHYDLGVALWRADQGERALGAFDAARRCLRESDPGHEPDPAQLRRARVKVALNVARCELELGHVVAAREELALAQEQIEPDAEPGLAVAASCLAGRVAEHVGEREGAAWAYRQALVREPRSVAAIAGLARLGRLAEIESVESLLREGGLREEDERGLRFALAQELDRRGDHRAAFAQALRANRLQPVCFDARAYERAADELLEAVREAGSAVGQVAGVSSLGVAEPEPATGALESGQNAVFVVGLPRSGTSLVEAMLAEHPAVAALGEHRELGRIGRERSASHGGHAQAYRALSSSEAVAAGARYAASLPAEARASARWIDKAPGNLLHLATAARALPQARVVHCTRDPRDACLSAWFQHFAEGAVVQAYDLDHLATHARVSERLAACWRETLGLAWFEVRYEDLVRDPEPVLRRLFTFLGLEWHPASLSFHTSARPVLTASATQVREPLHTRSIGRWRAYEPWLGPLAELELAPSS